MLLFMWSRTREFVSHKGVFSVVFIVHEVSIILPSRPQRSITLRQCVDTENVAAFIYLDDTIISTICREAMLKKLQNSEEVNLVDVCLTAAE